VRTGSKQSVSLAGFHNYLFTYFLLLLILSTEGGGAATLRVIRLLFNLCQRIPTPTRLHVFLFSCITLTYPPYQSHSLCFLFASLYSLIIENLTQFFRFYLKRTAGRTLKSLNASGLVIPKYQIWTGH